MIITHCSINNCDANSGKGAPRLRIRISGLKANVVTPVIDPGKLRMYGKERLSVRAKDIKSMTGTAALTGKTRILNIRLAGGVLTFAPNLLLDLFKNSKGKQFNGRQFFIDSANHQSGNLAGAIATAGFGAVAITIGGVAALTTAPVILFGLGLGIFAQACWNKFGGADWAARQGEDIVDNLPTVDFKYILP